MIIEFSVPGCPQPCQYQQTRRGVIYQKPATKSWQRAVGLAAAAAVRELCPGFKYGQYSGPATVEATFRIQPARSAKHESGSPHLQKPDVTNLYKGLEDGLKFVLWADDCQVQSAMIRKMWSNSNTGAEIRVDLVNYEMV